MSQIKRTLDFVSKKKKIANRYDHLLTNLPLVTPKQEKYALSSRHLYVIRIKNDQSKLSHHDTFQLLRKKNILVNLHYIPIHLQPFYRKLGFKTGDYPNAESYYKGGN